MKLFNLIVLILIMNGVGYGFIIDETLPPIQIDQYNNNQANVIYLPTHFSRPFIIDKKELKKMRDAKVHHIDLVYTAYKEAEDFDQVELNSQRIEELLKLMPQLETDQPQFSLYEQNGATNRKVAKNYFHGFVIHNGDDLRWQKQSEFFNDKQVPFSVIKINNNTGGRVAYYTGSSIEMKPLSVVDKDGNLVNGDYELYYREFRTQAEFILSGLPMTVDEDGVEKQFNSTGMYEIRAKKDGENLVLKDAAVVNFQTTEILPDVSFFSMSEEGHWNEEFELDYDETDISFQEGSRYAFYTDQMLGKQLKLSKYRPSFDFQGGAFQGYSRLADELKIDDRQFYAILSTQTWRVFAELYADETSPILSMVQDVNKEIKGMLISRDKSVEFIEMVLEFPMSSVDQTANEDGSITYSIGNIGKQPGLTNILGDEKIPPSPGLITGLSSAGFGVYNCDQTKRIEAPLAISPAYYDKATGKKLEDLYVTSIVDLNMNAAFSFHPNHLVINGDLNAKLVLFTKSKEIYLFDKKDFNSINTKAEQVDLRLENITAKVSNTHDLQQILDL